MGWLYSIARGVLSGNATQIGMIVIENMFSMLNYKF